MKKPVARPSAERVLDRAIELTFPASDPIAIEHAFRSARKRDQAVTRRALPKRPKTKAR